ncbi:MAG: GspL/Epsl periplasmic domain-containing protein, partial [Mariprofundaceae bacterium]
FRHGRWAARTVLAGLRPWRGAAVLALLVAAAWIVGAAWEHQRLESRIAAAQARIDAAFARALPGQPVIDPIVQLRRAAGGGGDGGSTEEWLAMMTALSRAFQEQPWTLKSLEWRDGEMQMRGEIADLQALNRLRERLASALGREIRLADTELGKDKVGFRMVWS